MTDPTTDILYLEDDDEMRDSVVRLLGRKGHHVCGVGTVSRFCDLWRARRKEWRALILDEYLAHEATSGLGVLRRLQAAGNTAPVFFLTNFDRELIGVEGVAGVLSKADFGPQRLATRLAQALSPLDPEQRALLEERPIERLPDLCRTLQLAGFESAVHSDRNLLLIGEPGTGKSSLAAYFFVRSGRQGGFVTCSMAGAGGDDLRNRLRGRCDHWPNKGDVGQPGVCELAGYGVVHLEDLESCDPAGLETLRATLQEDATVTRLGGTRAVAVRAGFVASANSLGPVGRAIESRFRVIEIPPLRERPDDVRALVPLIYHRRRRDAARPVDDLTPAQIERIVCHPLPHNIRSIGNIIGRLVFDPCPDFDAILDAEARPPQRTGVRPIADGGVTFSVSVRGGAMRMRLGGGAGHDVNWADLFGGNAELKRAVFRLVEDAFAGDRERMRRALQIYNKEQFDKLAERFSHESGEP